ncbi:MAG: PAS domain S-box protein [Pirellulales bacterium]
MVAPEYRQLIHDKVLSLTPDHPEAVDEHLSYDAHGELRWQEWRCRGLFDASGVLIELVSTGRDITERRLTEETLRRNEERYRLLTDQAGVVLWEGDPESLLFTYVSESAEGLLGIPADKWYEPGFWPAHVHPHDRDEALESCQISTARREDHRFEYRMIRGDGRVIWVEDMVKVIVDADDKVSLRGLLLDITERKAADEELRESRRLFGSAFDAAPVGMSIATIDGRFVQVNQALCRMLGYTEDELRGVNYREITYADDLAQDLRLADRLISGELPYYELEKRYVRRDGRAIWVLLFVSLVRDAAGTPLYGVAQVQDMTERRRLEEQLRHSQKMEAIGRLAGGIAHDFNNIITVVSTYGALLRERLPRDDFNHEAVQAVLDAADRASRLTRQIMAFSRKQHLEPEVVDVRYVVGEVRPLLRRLLTDDVELALELHDEPCLVKCDRHQLEQVLVNLAVNARDAMDGGGRLTISVRIVATDELPEAANDDPTIEHYVELCVADTGAGIDDEIKHRVFEPFFTTKPAGKGTGLGLAVVYGIVRQSGGHVEIDGGADGGAVIRVRLPRSSEPASEATHGDDADEFQGTQILLVDDDVSVRSAVQNILQDAGYHVTTVADAEAALEALQLNDEFELLLTDLVMPGADGREVARRSFRHQSAALRGRDERTARRLGTNRPREYLGRDREAVRVGRSDRSDSPRVAQGRPA